MTAQIRPIAIAVLALLGAAALAACGTDSVATSSTAARHAAAQKLIRVVHGVNPKAASGRIDATIDLRITGDSRYAGLTQVSANGVFDLPDGASVPDIELDVSLSRADQLLGGALVVHDGRGYVKLGEVGYELPPAISRTLVAPATTARNGLTKAAAMFHVNQQNWQRNAQLVGEATVVGERVQKITGEIRPELVFLDLARLVRFLTRIGVTQALGLPTELGPKLRAALVRSVTLAEGAVWIGKDDHVLRKATLRGRAVVAPRDRSLLFGARGATLRATVDISEVGAPQVIAAPAQRGSYADLRLSLSALAEASRRDAGRTPSSR